MRLAIWLGLAVSAFAVVYGAYAIGLRIFGGDVVTVAEGVVIFVCGALDGVARGHVGRSLRTLWTAPIRQAA